MRSAMTSAAALVRVVRRYGTSGARRDVTLVVFAAVVSLPLMLLGVAVANVVLELVRLMVLFVLAVLGGFPFGEVWVPLAALPRALAQLAPVWPAFHFARLAQYTVGGGGEFLPHVLGLAGMGILFFVLSRRALRKVR
jgi:ABC-2 type transport system permease protein